MQIKGVLESAHCHVILGDLLNESARSLCIEISDLEERLRAIESMADDLERYDTLTAASKLAMVRRMEDKRAEQRWRVVMICIGLAIWFAYALRSAHFSDGSHCARAAAFRPLSPMVPSTAALLAPAC